MSIVGPVLSMLMPVTAARELVLPATSMHSPDALCPAPWADKTTGGEHDAMPRSRHCR